MSDLATNFETVLAESETQFTWASLVIGFVILVLGWTLGVYIIMLILRRLARRTAWGLDDRLYELIKKQLRWLIRILFLDLFVFIAIPADYLIKTVLNDVFFYAYLVISFLLTWKLADFFVNYLGDKWKKGDDPQRAIRLIPVLLRIVQAFIIIIWVNILLIHYGINITTLATALGIGGLAISLAAQDTLSDVIAGFTILLDKPFRIGDRIEIQGLDTWGDVVEIGTRTTKIRTRDNRMVIVPNSTIGSGQVVNYTYPSPRYRVQVDINIDYGNDIEKIKKIAIETVRQVKGVLPDKPVDALYNEMADTMIFRIRWWIETYEDTRSIYDRVHSALQKAFDANEIKVAVTSQDITVKMANPPKSEKEKPFPPIDQS